MQKPDSISKQFKVMSSRQCMTIQLCDMVLMASTCTTSADDVMPLQGSDTYITKIEIYGSPVVLFISKLFLLAYWLKVVKNIEKTYEPRHSNSNHLHEHPANTSAYASMHSYQSLLDA